jgi:hypothetical protein
LIADCIVLPRHEHAETLYRPQDLDAFRLAAIGDLR